MITEAIYRRPLPRGSEQLATVTSSARWTVGSVYDGYGVSVVTGALEERLIGQLSQRVPFVWSVSGEVIGQRFLGNESHVEHFKLLERATTSILIGAR